MSPFHVTGKLEGSTVGALVCDELVFSEALGEVGSFSCFTSHHEATLTATPIGASLMKSLLVSFMRLVVGFPYLVDAL